MTMSKRVTELSVTFADGTTRSFKAREGHLMESKTMIEQDGAKPVEVRQVTVSIALDWSSMVDSMAASHIPQSIPEKGEATNGIDN